MASKLFTLAEAEELLPRIVPILEAIRDARRAMRGAEEELDKLLGPSRSNGHGIHGDRVESTRAASLRALTDLRARSAELQELGIELKDPDTGLIDFRALREGRVVYLCWRLGEDRIGWWHELDTGFAGRQRLDVT